MTVNLKNINTLLTTSLQFKTISFKRFSEIKPHRSIPNPVKHQRFQSRIVTYFHKKLHPRCLNGF